jgi:hypothetical protein
MVQVLGDGGFLLHEHVEGLGELMGVWPDAHYREWLDLDDLEAQIAFWLDPVVKQQRRKIALTGQAFIRERYTFDALVADLFEDKLPLIAAKDKAA